MEDFDLIVIGAGPGGYPAAIAAAEKGLKVALIEKDKLGGVCLNSGCIPTKFLLNASEKYKSLKKIADFGINVENYSFDFEKMMLECKKTVHSLTSGIDFLLKKHKIQIFFGKASIIKKTHEKFLVEVNGELFMHAKYVLLATGSVPKILPFVKYSSKIWNAKTALSSNYLPSKIGIIGGGVIGVEFANFYSNLESEVSVFEYFPEILNGIDPDLTKVLKKNLNSVKFNTNVKVVSVKEVDDKVEIEYEKNQEITKEYFDRVIVAAGIQPFFEGFEKFIEIENNYIKTDLNFETKTKNLFAVGDCVKGPWLAHKATYEAIAFVDYICGISPNKNQNIPMCIYTNPQIACVGNFQYDESNVEISISHFYANGKAVALKESSGFVKLVFDKKNQELIYAGMVGKDVTELIGFFSLGLSLEVLKQDLKKCVMPHPTLSEIFWENL